MNIETLCDKLSNKNVKYAIVGGHAVALHGAVRGTVDYDFIVLWNLKNLMQAESALQELGLQSRQPITAKDVFNFKDEYIKNKNMIAWNFYDPHNPLNQVDIIITHDLLEKQKKTITYNNIKIQFIGIHDLIEMKLSSNREQDKEDIKALREILNEN